MKTALRLVLLAALAALGVWLWTIYFPSPETIIHQRLDQLAKEASFAPNEGALSRLANAESLANNFATNVEVSINTREADRQEFVGRSQITQAAVAAPSQLSSLKIKFLDIVITVAPDKLTATADLTMDADVSGQPDSIVQQLKITFQKIDGKWLITRVTTVRVLSFWTLNPRPGLS